MTVRNSIIQANSPENVLDLDDDLAGTHFSYSNTVPQPPGPGNFNEWPEFVDWENGDF